MCIREITKRQFDSYCYIRQAHLRWFANELLWFDVFSKKLLAIVFQDRCDGDYGFVILGRDGSKIFRCLDLSEEFYQTSDDAKFAFFTYVEKYRNDGKTIYPEIGGNAPPNEILEPCMLQEKLHRYFRVLTEENRFEAARNLIKEIAYTFKDVDGNYIKDFQTTGFDGRLWELYLYVYFHTAGFEILRNYNAPDYHLKYFDSELFVEATTVNPTQGTNILIKPQETDAEIRALSRDYMPIKFGSALYSKIQKNYHRLPHVQGKPLLFAIHDFHMPGAMTWSSTALVDYLYGIRHYLKIDENGAKVPIAEKIDSHNYQGKSIPSNFFAQPGSEYISGVLFSNAATITKFNRMGKLAGMGSNEIKMLRIGTLFNPDPQAYDPIPFTVDVDSPEYEESWSDSLVLYHNPRALCPIDPDFFSDISQFWWDEANGLVGLPLPYEVLSSMTMTINPVDGDSLKDIG